MDDSFKPYWWGNYEFLRLLGVGGMAEVYLARTTGAQGFEKLVVVKRLLARLVPSERFVGMFVGEAKLAVRLQHANIVQVHSLEEFDGRPFIVMEYVHGQDLFSVLQRAQASRSNLPVDFGLHCLTEMLKGLGCAHIAVDADGQPLNLVHRDVTPSNVFISYDGEVKLGDFGVAHSTGAVQPSELRGKLGYLAPEATQRQHLDARADLFSAGVMLWEILAQRPLFSAATEGDTLRRLRDYQPEPPSVHNPRVPPDLDRLALKALAKDPACRFQTAAQFEEALSDYLYARGLRWTRRRIADVMQALFSTECQPVAVPPPSPRPQPDASAAAAEPSEELDDFSDETTRKINRALAGMIHTPARPPGSQPESPSRWPEVADGSPEWEVSDTLVDPEAAHRAESELILVYRHGSERPRSYAVPSLIGLLVDRPSEILQLGLVAGRPLPLAEFGRLCHWDSLVGLNEPDQTPDAESHFGEVSITRLLYELTVRRTTGLVVIEGGGGPDRRLLYLDGGYPLYVASDQPTDGAPALLLQHKMVDPHLLYRGLVRTISEQLPLDRALALAAGEQGGRQVDRMFSAVVRSRLFEVFGWREGRYRIFAGAVPSLRLASRVPPLLGILVRAVQRALTVDDLTALLEPRGQTALFRVPGRDGHLAALHLKPAEQAVVDAIDGQCDLHQLLEQLGCTSEEQQRNALAVLYVLAETGLIQFV